MKFPVVFALTGTVQGWVLWWLWHAQQVKLWPATQPMAMTAAVYATMAVPLVIYFTQGVDRLPAWVRRVAVAAYLVVYAALGAYAAWGSSGLNQAVAARPVDAFAALVLGFVSLGLLCGFDFDARRWRYERLFNYTWRNGILLATSGAMTGVVWLVLFAGAGLMSLIQVKWIMQMIQKPLFIFPITSLVVAAAFALGLGRASMTESIRRFWLSISSWLLPLVLFFGVLWVAVVPFTGLDVLFKTKSAALMMLWFTALAVKFSNCAYQDGEVAWPYPGWLSRVTQVAWFSLLPVVAIAWWALGLRVAQYGWSEQRLWAGLVAILAGIYAVGYALSWLKTDRWMSAIARTNIAAALVLCLGLLAFITPLANVQKLAVSAHISHVTAAGGKVEPDWKYLRWQSGRFGVEALQTFAAGGGVPAGLAWAKQAAEMLAETSHYNRGPNVVTAQIVANKFPVYPKGRTLPPTFVQHVQADTQTWLLSACLKPTAKCTVWLGDMNGDGADEVVVFNVEHFAGGQLFVQSQGTWRHGGSLSSSGQREKFDGALLEGALTGKPEWSDLLVGGQRFRVQLH